MSSSCARRRPDAMAVGMDEAALRKAFPFHFVCDSELRIVQMGPSLERVLPAMGRPLPELFVATQPELALEVETVRRRLSTLFVLTCHAPAGDATGMRLRGQFVETGNEGQLLFLGSPWLDDASALSRHGLRFADFAPHDATLEGLFLQQAQRSTQADVERVMAQLEELASERHRLEQAERALEHELSASSDFRIRLDRDARILEIRTSESLRLFGGEPDLAVGQVVHDVVPDLGAVLITELPAVFNGGAPRAFEFSIKRGVGMIHLECRAASTLAGDAIVVGRDVTDRRELEEQLRHQALHDSLTRLPNRTLLRRRLTRAVRAEGSRRSGMLTALFFIDLDDFKAVNDGLGHAVGDEVLVAVAERIEDALRPSDTAARLGGDEFAVLLEELEHPSQALEIAERLVEAVSAPLWAAGSKIEPSCSIGITVAQSDGDPEELFRQADLAMYRAKANGKNGVDLFDEGLQESAKHRLLLKQDLVAAREHDEFVMHYQPIVDLAELELVGLEALVRWQHPEHGLLGPDSFISLAEESGAIVAIGKGILDKVCARAAAWHAQGSDLRMSINLSAKQLGSAVIVEHVGGALETSGLDPRLLTLEITESHAVQDLEKTIRILDDLRRLGVQIAMDDFGKGYSALTYLEQLPIDVLKIDKAFVDRLGGATSAPLAESVVELGHRLELQVVAEGIEHRGQLEALRRLGCARGQGYFFSKPVPEDVVSGWIDAAGAGRHRFAPPGDS
ncbi:MAG: EAL domain-containing protein [Myxococcota bacterium]